MTEPRNLTLKLLADHLSAGDLAPGEELDLRVDQILIEDATGSMTALQFVALGVERVQVPLAVMYVDHNVLQIDDKNMDEHRYLQSFSARYGVLYSRPGNGISHYIHLERFARPGGLLVGADSHSTMAGALGMFAVGAGGSTWRWPWPVTASRLRAPRLWASSCAESCPLGCSRKTLFSSS